MLWRKARILSLSCPSEASPPRPALASLGGHWAARGWCLVLVTQPLCSRTSGRQPVVHGHCWFQRLATTARVCRWNSCAVFSYKIFNKEVLILGCVVVWGMYLFWQGNMAVRKRNMCLPFIFAMLSAWHFSAKEPLCPGEEGAWAECIAEQFLNTLFPLTLVCFLHV